MAKNLFDAAFFSQLSQVKLVTKQRMNSAMNGGRKSSAKGSSVEFSDFREYMLGDDIRRIDWNAYGRMDRFFVKLFMEEKEGLFHIFFDTSDSMNYGEYSKYDQARKVAALFSYMVLNNLDRMYLYPSGQQKDSRVSGITGRQSFQKVLRYLEEVPCGGVTDWNRELRKFSFGRRGTVILISDFFENESLEEALRFLAFQKQEVILVQILSKEELHPEQEGHCNLIDSESKKEMRVTVNHGVLQQYERTLCEFLDHLKELSKRYQAAYVFCESKDPLTKVLYEYQRQTPANE